MGELLIGIALIIICLLIYSQSGNFPNFNEVHLNAGSFPKTIAILLGLLSLFLIVSKVKELLSQKGNESKINITENLKNLYKEYRLPIITLIILFLYVFLMEYIGFILTTISFIIVTGLVIGPKRKKNVLVISAVAVLITISTYLFFENVLHVRFPSGFFF